MPMPCKFNIEQHRPFGPGLHHWGVAKHIVITACGLTLLANYKKATGQNHVRLASSSFGERLKHQKRWPTPSKACKVYWKMTWRQSGPTSLWSHWNERAAWKMRLWRQKPMWRLRSKMRTPMKMRQQRSLDGIRLRRITVNLAWFARNRWARSSWWISMSWRQGHHAHRGRNTLCTAASARSGLRPATERRFGNTCPEWITVARGASGWRKVWLWRWRLMQEFQGRRSLWWLASARACASRARLVGRHVWGATYLRYGRHTADLHTWKGQGWNKVLKFRFVHDFLGIYFTAVKRMWTWQCLNSRDLFVTAAPCRSTTIKGCATHSVQEGRTTGDWVLTASSCVKNGPVPCPKWFQCMLENICGPGVWDDVSNL